MLHQLTQLRLETEKELSNILNYWTTWSIDSKNGGFYGRIDNNNKVFSNAPKGSVLNARILWTFSAANSFNENLLHADIASRACDYIIKHFIDDRNGGVYWTINVNGEPLETKKQTYACAFVIYALSEYCRSVQNEVAKQHAIDLYNILVKYTWDDANGGFFEAFTRDWAELHDQRLSAKDANEKKTTNTNLHVLEAFSNLYLIWPDENLKSQIMALLKIFDTFIIDPGSGHLKLFFDEMWNHRPDVISYGHDIEASWLLLQCAEVTGDEKLITTFRNRAIILANAAMKGLDKDGGLWYEFDIRRSKTIYEKHWWPQAEGLVGFFNAWQLTNEDRFLHTSLDTWKFITTHLLNPSGEWYWGIYQDGTVMKKEDKIGLWKCPYHNARACLEILKRTGDVNRES